VARRGHQPGADQRGLLDLAEMFDQRGKDELKDIGRLLVIQPGLARDRIDQPLVAID